MKSNVTYKICGSLGGFESSKVTGNAG